MGAHFPSEKLCNATRFSIVSRKSGFLWHSLKWACWFGHFLQYMSGIEVLACSIDTTLTMWLLCSNCTLPWTTKFFGCIPKDIYYVTPQRSLRDPRPSAEFFNKMLKFLRFLAEYLVALAFSYWHYMFELHITCLTLSFNTVHIYFHWY